MTAAPPYVMFIFHLWAHPLPVSTPVKSPVMRLYWPNCSAG